MGAQTCIPASKIPWTRHDWFTLFPTETIRQYQNKTHSPNFDKSMKTMEYNIKWRHVWKNLGKIWKKSWIWLQKSLKKTIMLLVMTTPKEGRSTELLILLSSMSSLLLLLHCMKSVRILSFSGTEYLSVFSPNAAKRAPEKLRIRTLFTQC